MASAKQLTARQNFIAMIKAKKAKGTIGQGNTPVVVPQQPASTAPIGNLQVAKQTTHPMVPMSPAMVTSIKTAPKGKIPPGLAKYLASHKKKGK